MSRNLIYSNLNVPVKTLRGEVITENQCARSRSRLTFFPRLVNPRHFSISGDCKEDRLNWRKGTHKITATSEPLSDNELLDVSLVDIRTIKVMFSTSTGETSKLRVSLKSGSFVPDWIWVLFFRRTLPEGFTCITLTKGSAKYSFTYNAESCTLGQFCNSTLRQTNFLGAKGIFEFSR